ncbi:nitrogen fixation protein NifU [Dehalococcoides mccartyi]|jgi:nitrogen fixation NifU-like protein|uniref:Iron-sulfur cluster assembly scaffold protein IscU/NifU-like n=3 Tax=Dehalococcoides mccartyi TaxID=61435 RepID=A0A142V9W8_9CHLR|nr:MULTISPECIES: iron-sulfur cluster assembly scaffold protein [Dehalococcoides]AGG06496.1 NifU-domain-containing protein [Dehalococcoides mccartyi DCMB5]AMU86630.1 NifU domain-containing protein [Dehalococcoides mccartyi]AQU05936.1 iron-sulfur cluster assembly scaffold protein [Dehalococcoides mccartyi]AQU07381.1 iron-sulfur cluster assembly scaffold protein [Dehalococcoides mccartyi]KSV17425.1 nitrogen fixation protein NifU [Dehalococcoides mccartyi]
MTLYFEKVMEYFVNPLNSGEMENPDGIGRAGNAVCGDVTEFYIRVKDNRLVEVKFKTYGCGAAVAISSLVSLMATGKTIEEAMKIDNKAVEAEIKGLPQNRNHCSQMGPQALHSAIADYKIKVQARG